MAFKCACFPVVSKSAIACFPRSLFIFIVIAVCCKCFFPFSFHLLVYDSGIHFRMQLLHCWSCSLFSGISLPFRPSKGFTVQHPDLWPGDRIQFRSCILCRTPSRPNFPAVAVAPDGQWTGTRQDTLVHPAAPGSCCAGCCYFVLPLTSSSSSPAAAQDLLLHKTNRVMQYICIRSFMCHPS